ncbi:MAG: hypothetical protein K940chlam1_01357 [Candidatus Anoxychlamydiales bacterium]|nr:hypothetical protein [Candidatus Anoxychlamydiales bacterium]NGX36262.1 hypothetical protein [Candidatus Anoxychlamydiales bacterium]
MPKLLFIVAFVLVGCHFPSKMAMNGSGGRNAYNIEVQKTNAEEMLLNLVRLRYYDSPFFLEVSSVTSQFTFKNSATASINIPGFDKINPMNIGGETLWQNQPTIQYSPLQGQEFANQLMQPIDIGIIQQIIYSGWDIDRVFMLTVQNFQEYPNIPREGLDLAEKTKHIKFHEVVYLMKELQMRGDLQVGIRLESEPGAKTKNLQFAFPSDNDTAKEVAQLMKGEMSANGKYIINIVQGFDEKGNIGILPRSLLSCMHYLSKSVIIPVSDIEDKKACSLQGEKFDIKHGEKKLVTDLLTVYNVPRKPKDAYVAIKYRDTWFYIKDEDLHSKKTFMLLLELFNLQSGRAQDRGPVLTLPIGVG